MKTTVEKLPKATMKITVTVENNAVKQTFEKMLDKRVETTELEGFRKGNAPREMVKEKVGLQTLYGDTLNEVLETYYPQALKEAMILPVSNPKVDISEFDIEKDLVFTATVAVRPEIKVGDYKKALKTRYNEKIETAKKDKPEEEPHVHLGTNELMEVILKESTLEVADMLLEDEADRMMTRLVNQAQSINLSLDQYLKSQNKSPDQLRKEYLEVAERNIKAEFVLAHLVKEENIEISDSEIEEAIKAVGDASVAERLKDPMEKLYIKSILQKNKLISKLIEETEGEHTHANKE